MLKRTYELDMVPGGIPLSVHLSQYDSDVALVFQLYASQGTLDIPSDGVTAQIRGTKLDGNGISAECSFEILDDVPTVTAHMTKQMTAIAGKNTFELVLTAVSGNTTYDLPSANFYLEIERAALDYDTLQSKSEIQEIEAILSNADGIIAALEVSRETQANMAALTTRAESAASSAESAASTASQARTDAVSAKDTAVNAVQGFNDTVNSATSSAVQSLQSEAQAQIANVQTAGNGIEEHAASVVASAKEAITSEKDTAVSAIGSEKESAVASVEFEMVQREMAKRGKGKKYHSGVHAFSTKIKCGECGSWYGSKVWHSNSKYRKTIWQCNHKFDGDCRCQTPHLTDEEIQQHFLSAANKLLSTKTAVIANGREMQALLFDTTELEAEQAQLLEETQVVSDMVQQAIQENARTALNQTEYQKRYDSLVQRFDRAKTRLEEVTAEIQEKQTASSNMGTFLNAFEQMPDALAEFSPESWHSMVDFATVYSIDDIRFTFKNGQEIQA